MADETLADRLAIRDVVESWVLARDSANWDWFRAQWHDDGYMMATWFQGPKEDFIRVSREGYEKGVSILHYTGASQATVAGTRAISQTRMTIMQRGDVHGVQCDVSCIGRFYDFFEKRDGRWGIVLRQPIYEKDWLLPVTPGVSSRARPWPARAVPRRLQAPRVPAGAGRVPGQAGHARAARPGGGSAVRARRRLAGRRARRALSQSSATDSSAHGGGQERAS